MQRVEPSEVRTYVEPIPNGSKLAEARSEDAAATSTQDASADRVENYDHATAPNNKLTWAAFGFSVIWIAGGIAYIVGFTGLTGAASVESSVLLPLAAAAIVPCALAFLAAAVATEARELRAQSTALASASLQLLEPEEHAARKLARLSRAIRREIDSFNGAVESAAGRMASLESSSNERLALIERTAMAAQERVERATNKLGSEREKLAQFTQALDAVVLAASETLTTRLQDARAAARTASESLHAEHGAIAGLISTLQSASHGVSAKALETSREIERQAQRLDAASEAAAARSEQVVARHEKQRGLLAETIERLKQENDHMARALEYQREGMSKLVAVMAEENKKVGTFTIESARRLDDAAAIMAQRIVETTQLFSREAEKLRTSTELTTTGLEQAMQSIRSAGDSSFDAAGRLGSVLIGLKDTANGASQQVETVIVRLSKMLNDLPSDALAQAKQIRALMEQQSSAVRELESKVKTTFDRLQNVEASAQALPPAGLPSPTPSYVHQQQQAHTARPVPMQAPIPQQPVRSMPQAPAAPPLLPRPAPEPTYVQHANQQAAQHFPREGHAPRDAQGPQRPLPHFLGDHTGDGEPPAFNVPAASAQVPMAGYNQSRVPMPDRSQGEPGEARGWFGLAKRLVRPSADDGEPVPEERNNWDIKSLLAATDGGGDTRPRTPHAQQQNWPQQHTPNPAQPDPRYARQAPPPAKGQQPAPPVRHSGAQPQHLQGKRPVSPNGYEQAQGGASSRHMIETLQAMAIDLCRFLEDDPPVDLLRRYRNGERNVFARRLAGMLGPDHIRLITGKYSEDREFRETTDRYILQFEALLEQTARNDKDNVLVETYLASQTGKIYVTLASAVGRLS